MSPAHILVLIILLFEICCYETRRGPTNTVWVDTTKLTVESVVVELDVVFTLGKLS